MKLFVRVASRQVPPPSTTAAQAGTGELTCDSSSALVGPGVPLDPLSLAPGQAGGQDLDEDSPTSD